MKVMNCREIAESIVKIRQLNADLIFELKNKNNERAWSFKQEITNLVDDIESNNNDIALRDKIAKERGYKFVDKFTKSGFARVEEDPNRWFMMNRQGEQVGREYFIIGDFRNGFAECKVSSEAPREFIAQNGKNIELKGETVDWDVFGSSNVLIFRDADKGVYFLNDLGERINDQYYIEAGRFHEGLAWVKKEDESGNAYETYIRPNGEEADVGIFRKCDNFYNGFACVKDAFGDHIIDKEGHVVLSRPGLTIKFELESEDEVTCIYWNNSQSGGISYNFLDSKGRLVFDGSFSDVGPMNERLAWVRKNSAWFIGKSYGSLKLYGDKEDKNAMLDREVNPIFSDGVSVLQTADIVGANRWGVVNREGKLLLDVPGKALTAYKKGFAILTLPNNKRVLMDKSGNQSREYIDISRSRDFMIAKSEEGMFVLDRTGKPVLGPADRASCLQGPMGKSLISICQGDKSRLLDENLREIRDDIVAIFCSREGAYDTQGKDGKLFYIDIRGNTLFRDD